jgi:cyclopropane-fatty-acyl-phospholipid synthase
MINPPLAAAAVGALAESLLREPLTFGLRCWDGSRAGPPDAKATLVLRSPLALRRVLYAPGELGLARSYAAGELDVEGDLLWLLEAVRPALRRARALRPAALARAIRVAGLEGVLGAPLPPTPEEAKVARWRGPLVRDRRGTTHHYDMGNEFYRLVLGPSMTYSCARFVAPDDTLEAAQEAKHDLICHKLGLEPGMRLLDVGCGWGALARHAASRYGAEVVGITLSAEQRDWAMVAAEQEGLASQVDIRLQHFRELAGEQFDAVCSVGMYEHVGPGEAETYFEILYRALRPGGRLLNHAISKPGGSHYGSRSFLLRYVFPNGRLRDVGATAQAMERAGFELRDVECLREHYALTLRAWVANLERHWAKAEALVGGGRARIWRLYMTGAINSFESASIAVHQVLGAKLAAGGQSGMPMTRAGWG